MKSIKVSSAVLLLAALFAYSLLLLEFFRSLWDKPHYQYFPFVIAAVGWLLYSRIDPSAQKSETITSVVLQRIGFVLSLSLLAIAVLVHSPWLGAVSCVLFVGALLASSPTARAIPYVWGIWILLWLLIPFPFGFDQRLISGMQWRSALLSSILLDQAGVLHLNSGNVLLLPNKELFVDEACSGIVSLLSIVACAAIYGVWRNRAPLHVILLAFAGVFWATFTNVVRIAIVTAAESWWGLNWAEGSPHEILGLLLFLIAFVALVSTDQLLLGFLSEVEAPYLQTYGDSLVYGGLVSRSFDRLVEIGVPANSHSPTEQSVSSNTPQVGSKHFPQPATQSEDSAQVRGFAKWVLTASLLGIGLLDYSLLQMVNTDEITTTNANVTLAAALTQKSMPQSYCGLDLLKFDAGKETVTGYGVNSRTFTYVDEENNRYLVSCDFPFIDHWHELTQCYQWTGWTLINRKIHNDDIKDIKTAKPDAIEFVTAEFEKGDEKLSGYLVFGCFDEAGLPFNPPGEGLRGALESFVETRHQRFLAPRILYQIQVWTMTPGPTSEKIRMKAQDLFHESFHDLQGLIANKATQVSN